MGLTCSCPLAIYFDFENGLESILSSITLTNDDRTTPVRPISPKPKNYEPKILQPQSSEGSVRFRARKTQSIRLMRKDAFGRSHGSSSSTDLIPYSPMLCPNSPQDEAAAVKLQKVYKSFRTRRKLADCAVLIEQSWWKLLDFAELKRSSISFFEVEKHETAVSRWSRARTRAAKVGKGLSENGKAQKLALQHWLEAIDPRHRYGHNLHFYYMKWLNSQSKEPFFYWLDIGEGKEVNLVEKCSRSKLQQQCIKYLGPMERNAYEVSVDDGKLVYKETGELLNTTNEPNGCKWIFVLSTSRTLYVGKKKKGSFQHSSFLAGGATLAAGRVVAENGVLKAVWPHSGHYRPTPENFEDFLSFLRDNNVDLTDVKLDSTDDEDSSVGNHVRSNSSADDLIEKDRLEFEQNIDFHPNKVNSKKEEQEEEDESSYKHGLLKLKSLTIPRKDELGSEIEIGEPNTKTLLSESPPDENLTAVKNPEEQEDEENIPEEHILRRINSHKGTKSFQLGKQLSCKWSTGAGPRIGCLRDYPSGLQSHALEQVSLSPRSRRRLRFEFPSRSLTPTGSNISRSLTPTGSDISRSLNPIDSNLSCSLTRTGSNLSRSLTPTESNISRSLTPTGSDISRSLNPIDSNLSRSLTRTGSNLSRSLTPTESNISRSLTSTESNISHSLTPIDSNFSHSLTPIRSNLSCSLTPIDSNLSRSLTRTKSNFSRSLTPIDSNFSRSLTPTGSNISRSLTSIDSNLSRSLTRTGSNLCSSFGGGNQLQGD